MKNKKSRGQVALAGGIAKISIHDIVVMTGD